MAKLNKRNRTLLREAAARLKTEQHIKKESERISDTDESVTETTKAEKKYGFHASNKNSHRKRP